MAGELPFGLAPSGALTNYQPTLRERVTDWLRPMLFSDDREGQGRAERLVNVAETVLPPFGFATQMYDTGRAGGEGDYLTAATLGAMAMAPGAKLPSSETQSWAIRKLRNMQHAYCQSDAAVL